MKLKANEYIYSIKNLTYGEVRQIEYAYGQFIHNAVSGDFTETNGRLDDLRARIEKKPITETSSDEEFITIPKPKFQMGDVVKVIYGEKTKWEIEGRYYSPDVMKWYYNDFGDMINYSEDELELVDAGL